MIKKMLQQLAILIQLGRAFFPSILLISLVYILHRFRSGEGYYHHWAAVQTNWIFFPDRIAFLGIDYMVYLQIAGIQQR